jgi:hypothetical protein
MNIIQILNEGKKERLIDKFRPQLEGLSDDAISLAEQIIDNDPSVTKKYSEWGIKKFIDTVKNPTWNFQSKPPITIASTAWTRVKMYHDIVENLSPEKVEKMFNFLELDDHFSSEETEKKIKSKPKDINSFDTIQDLLYFVEQYDEFLKVADDEKQIKKESERIYEDDRFLIIRPLSYKSSRYYGANTTWCTTNKDDDDCFNKNTSRGKLYYILDKKSTNRTYGKMALLVPHGKGAIEIYNQKDQAETYSFLLDRFEPIKEKIIELVSKSNDYETLKKVKQNPKLGTIESLNSDYFYKFIGDKVVFNFKGEIESYLSFFRDAVGDDTLGRYSIYDQSFLVTTGHNNWMFQNPNGDFFYDTGKFDDDMSEGYPLYSLTSEQIDILKAIIEILQPQLLSSFEGNDIKRDDLKSVADFIKDNLPDLYESFSYAYSDAEDKSLHRGFLDYIESDICDIYEDIGLKKVENSECFWRYEISVDKLLEFYEDDLESNKNFPVEQVLENQVLGNLELNEYPYEMNDVYRDDDIFRHHFDDDMERALEKELDRVESDESLILDSKQYKRISNYIENKFGFNTPHKIKSADEETIILFNGVDPKTNKVKFTLVKDDEEKKGSAKLETIIKLLTNYTLFDPF